MPSGAVLSLAAFCERCGARLRTDGQFCDKCGANQGEVIRRLVPAARGVQRRKDEYREELKALRTEVDNRFQGNLRLRKANDAIETEISDLSAEKERTEAELANLARSAETAKAEANRLQETTRSLNNDNERLNQRHSDADNAVKGLRQQADDLAERVGEPYSRSQWSTLTSNLVENSAKFNEILFNSIDAAITDLLGETVRPSLYNHLAKHYDITRDEIPYRLDSLYAALDQIFGFKASKTLERQIAKHLCFAFAKPFPDTHEYSSLRQEADRLTAAILDPRSKKDATQNELEELRTQHARLLLGSSAEEHVPAVRHAREVRQQKVNAPTISRTVKVTLLILAVIATSLLTAGSLHASSQSNRNDPPTITETYLSVTTSVLTVSSQFTVTPQIDRLPPGLSIPVFGRWITPTITIHVNPNSSLESWILTRAVQTWNGAEANFSRGTPPYALSQVTGQGQITVNFVSSLPADLDALTTCQQTELLTGSSVNGLFTSCTIQMLNGMFTPSEEQLAFLLALHELGHALGLGELMGTTDLMDASGWQQSTGISTLDLYALQTLAYVPAGSQAPNFIALPEGTPYEVSAVNV